MPATDPTSPFNFDGPGRDPDQSLPASAIQFAGTCGARARGVKSALLRFQESRETPLKEAEWQALIRYATNGLDAEKSLSALGDLQGAKRTDLTLEELDALANMANVTHFQTKSLVSYLTTSLRVEGADRSDEFIKARTSVLSELCEMSGGKTNIDSLEISGLGQLQTEIGRAFTVAELKALCSLAKQAQWQYAPTVAAYFEIAKKGGEVSAEGLKSYSRNFEGLSPARCRNAAKLVQAFQAASEEPLSAASQKVVLTLARELLSDGERFNIDASELMQAVETLCQTHQGGFSHSIEDKVALAGALHRINHGLDNGEFEGLVETVSNYLVITDSALTPEGLKPLEQLINETLQDVNIYGGSDVRRLIDCLQQRSKLNGGSTLDQRALAAYVGPLRKIFELCEDISMHDGEMINLLFQNLESLHSPGQWYLEPEHFGIVLDIVGHNIRYEARIVEDGDLENLFRTAEFMVEDFKSLEEASRNGLSTEDWIALRDFTVNKGGNSLLPIRGLGYVQRHSQGRSIVQTLSECGDAILEFSRSGYSPEILVEPAKIHSLLERRPISAEGIKQSIELALAPNEYNHRDELAAFSTRAIPLLGIENYQDWITAMRAGLEKAASLDCSLREIAVSKQ